MRVNTDEEKGCAVGMYITDKSAVVDISADVGNGGEGSGDIGSVMYG